MTEKLESYASGRWFRADDEGRPVHDAVTGEEVTRISASGLDLGAMVAHGRTTGVAALDPRLPRNRWTRVLRGPFADAVGTGIHPSTAPLSRTTWESS